MQRQMLLDLHALLIEPVWNWNFWRSQRNEQSPRLLIEPVWNWNVNLDAKTHVDFNLLIEPVWNWNLSSLPSPKTFISLLIEPVWNWNDYIAQDTEHHIKSFNRTSLELKLSPQTSSIPQHWTFNRTSLELKRLWVSRYAWATLLIEPVWNWNWRPIGRFQHARRTFNRTSLELKQKEIQAAWSIQQPFNRTSLELKHLLPV